MEIQLNKKQREFLEHIKIHGQYMHRWPANIASILKHGYYNDAPPKSGVSSDLEIITEVRSGYIAFLKKHKLKYPG